VSNPPEPLYIEDLAIGSRFVSGSYQITAEEIKSFAAEFDPQPFHLDDLAGKNSLFGGLAASGWHTAGITMRLIVESMPLARGVVGVGGEIAWPQPTRPGDILHVESEIIDIIPSRSKPNQALATVRSITLNQAGEVVYTLTAKILVYRRA
jgi:acyl dehydratase